MNILVEILLGIAACAAITWGYITLVLYLVYSALGFSPGTAFHMAATFIWTNL